MFVARRVPVDVIDLFMKIAFHATAYGRIELGEVADLHWIADLRFAICDLAAVFFDDAKLGNKFRLLAGSAGGAVISCYRGAAPDQLGSYCLSLNRLRQRTN